MSINKRELLSPSYSCAAAFSVFDQFSLFMSLILTRVHEEPPACKKRPSPIRLDCDKAFVTLPKKDYFGSFLSLRHRTPLGQLKCR